MRGQWETILPAWHARTGHFGPASVKVLHWMAKDSAPCLAQETGQALGLVCAQHAMRSAAQLNAQALAGTLRMMYLCVFFNVNASLSDLLPLSAHVPFGPDVALRLDLVQGALL
eukprot:2180064-Amphidinium_carterae.1